VRSFAVSAIGRDRPGIVAAVTKVLLDHDLNIEDAQATILRGHFTLTMICSGGDHVEEGILERDLEAVRERLGLEAAVAREVNVLPVGREPEATHAITVFGLDRPGIVHAVCTTLADAHVDIADLNSRLVGEDDGAPLYAMQLEVVLTGGDEAEGIDRALASIAEATGIEITLRPLAE
jgi:glycine cleavage system transcriptional repressor